MISVDCDECGARYELPNSPEGEASEARPIACRECGAEARVHASVETPSLAGAEPQGEPNPSAQASSEIAEHTTRDESARGETARDETARGETARGETARGETARGETARDETAGAAETAAADQAASPVLGDEPDNEDTIVDARSLAEREAALINNDDAPPPTLKREDVAAHAGVWDAEAPPDSEIPIDSLDFLKSAPPVAPEAPHVNAEARETVPEKPRMLPAPPMKTRPELFDAADSDPPPPLSHGTPTLAALVRNKPRKRRMPRDGADADSAEHALLGDSNELLAGAPLDNLLKPPVTDAPVAASRPPDAPRSTKTNSSLPLLLMVGGAALVLGFLVERGAGKVPEPETVSMNAAIADPNKAATPPERSAGAAQASAEEPAESASAQSNDTNPNDAPPNVNASDPKPEAPSTTVSSGASAHEAVLPSKAANNAAGALPRPSSIKRTEAAADVAFDAQAASGALEQAAQRASGCKKPTDPSGMAVVTITFSPSGHVTTANISGPPFAGTETGSCIASTMRTIRVPAFGGDFITVKKTVHIQ